MVGAARVLGGRYRLEERVAAGGMGTVFAATDERLGRRVAVKVLKEELTGDPRFVERFRREARAAGALSHPNVATVFDFGEDAGTPFIVMELVPGRDLARVLREDGAVGPDRARAVGAQLCAALAHAHAAGLVHRDVKPANVIVDENDRVKVTDFGIARAAGESTLTQTGSVFGSAQYMAPEQASGAPVTAAADVYAAGIVLYEVLTSSVPFTGESPLAVAMRHVSDDVPAPSALNPAVPADLDDLVRRATSKDPAARPTATEMAAALEARPVAETAPLTAGATQVIGPAGATGETTVWPIPGATYDPRRLGTRVLVVAGVLALLSAGVWIWVLTKPDEDERPAARASAAARATEQAQPASEAYELEDLTGWEFEDAEKELKERGLVVVRLDVPSVAPADEVLRSDPEPGTAMSEGETVTLTVSTGPAEGDEPEEDEGEEEDEGPGNSESAPGHSKGKGKDKD
jgi:serine/threonine-protein kinase